MGNGEHLDARVGYDFALGESKFCRGYAKLDDLSVLRSNIVDKT